MSAERAGISQTSALGNDSERKQDMTTKPTTEELRKRMEKFAAQLNAMNSDTDEAGTVFLTLANNGMGTPFIAGFLAGIEFAYKYTLFATHDILSLALHEPGEFDEAYDSDDGVPDA
jgi:hypothetical protein